MLQAEVMAIIATTCSWHRSGSGGVFRFLPGCILSKHVTGTVMELAWTERLSVGNAILDTEHKQLVDMVNSIERAIRTRDSHALLQAFKPFEDYVRVHFENEAKIAQLVEFSFAQHALEHHYVLEELRSMGDELAANDGRWSESAAEHYSYFLSEWLIEHLLEEDMLMKPALQKLPYSFKPD